MSNRRKLLGKNGLNMQVVKKKKKKKMYREEEDYSKYIAPVTTTKTLRTTA